MAGEFSAGLHTKSRFRWNLASFYIDGGFDDAIIFDSKGRRFEVELIELRKPVWWRYVLDRLGHLMILPNPDIKQMVEVDMILRQTDTLDLQDFCQHVIDTLLANPSWWKRFSTETRVRQIFEGDETFTDAINHIGIYEPLGKLSL